MGCEGGTVRVVGGRGRGKFQVPEVPSSKLKTKGAMVFCLQLGTSRHDAARNLKLGTSTGWVRPFRLTGQRGCGPIEPHRPSTRGGNEQEGDRGADYWSVADLRGGADRLHLPGEGRDGAATTRRAEEQARAEAERCASTSWSARPAVPRRRTCSRTRRRPDPADEGEFTAVFDALGAGGSNGATHLRYHVR